MEFLGFRLVFAPGGAFQALTFVTAGVLLGTCSGLVPGLHVNALALLLAATAPAIPGPPHLVAATMLAAALVHSFLDVIPSLALGVPDPAMAASALPGHRLVVEGRGREALRLSVLRSGGAVLLAVPLAVPMTTVMGGLYPLISEYLPLVLGAVVAFLTVTERGGGARLGAVLAFLSSGVLGLVTLPLAPAGILPTGDLLTPLFGGLFGAPVLVEALDGDGVPAQADPNLRLLRRLVAAAGAAGTLAGAVVGFVPGISSAIAATVALAALPARTGARGFIVATSGVNTANATFALLALITLGTPRTGVMVAMEQAQLPLNLPLLLATVLLAAAAGSLLVLILGDAYLRVVGDMNYRRLSVVVLVGLAALAVVFAGPVGLLAFVTAGAIGLIPPRFGARRVHLMGVLILRSSSERPVTTALLVGTG
ncbi:MAG: tripartite tricarboxylate transporter permease [Halobacteriaceae archaeon]